MTLPQFDLPIDVYDFRPGLALEPTDDFLWRQRMYGASRILRNVEFQKAGALDRRSGQRYLGQKTTTNTYPSTVVGLRRFEANNATTKMLAVMKDDVSTNYSLYSLDTGTGAETKISADDWDAGGERVRMIPWRDEMLLVTEDEEVKKYAQDLTIGGTASQEDVVPLGLDVPSAPTLAEVSGAGNLPANTYRYQITWVSSKGLESNASNDASLTVAGGSDQIDVTRPAIPAGEDIANWRVYRSAENSSLGFATSLRFFVAEVAIGTATYNDDGSTDDSDLDFATLTPIDNTKPPANVQFGLVHLGRFWYAGHDRETLGFSKIGQPGACPARFQLDMQEYGIDQITGIGKWRNFVVVFGRDAVVPVSGTNPIDIQGFPLDSSDGCASHDSIVSFKDSLKWLGERGVFELRGGQVDNIDDEFVRSEVLDISPKSDAAAARFNDSYYLAYRKSGSTNDKILKFDDVAKAWSEIVGRQNPSAGESTGHDAAFFFEEHSQSQGENLFYADSAQPEVIRFGTTQDDFGDFITLDYQSFDFPGDHPVLRKGAVEFLVKAIGIDNLLNATISVDRTTNPTTVTINIGAGGGVWDTDTWDNFVWGLEEVIEFRTVLPADLFGNSFRVRIAETSSGSNFSLLGYSLFLRNLEA